MAYLPQRFCEELRKTSRRMATRGRHLMLLDYEGLHVLERWRETRIRYTLKTPKDIYR